MKKPSLQFRRLLGKGLSLLAFLILITSIATHAAKKYSAASGNWTSTSTWTGGVVPVAGDTVYILGGQTVTVNSNLYSNSTYMFLIVVGTLDMTSNGKISLNGSSKVIVERSGRILGDSNGDQISIGTGGAEYKGDTQGIITGPSYVGDNHNPVSGEGTSGCGCYSSVGSCSYTSTDGYTVYISLTIKSLVKPATCASGYNYNVKLDYLISFSGTNIPAGGLWTLQGNLTCGSQTLFFDLPNTAGAGTTTTTSNPWRGVSDCSTATTVSLGCLTAVTDVQGSGINSGNPTTCTSSTGTLPIRLVSFTGEEVVDGVKLDWKTSMEKDFDSFEIERAQDDLNFKTIATVEGKGGIDILTSYTYLDRSAHEGKNYYRLKSVDLDGTFEYSNLILVTVGNGQGTGFKIYPTIVDESTFTIELDDSFQGEVALSLLNSVGAIVYETALGSGTSIVTIPPAVKNGVYLVQLRSINNRKAARIVVR